LAVYLKAGALKVASSRFGGGARALAAGDVLAAAFVLAFGLTLLTGIWSAGAPG
jgi:hypothetical protein